MKRGEPILGVVVLCAMSVAAPGAQESSAARPVASVSRTAVPQLIKFSGKLQNLSGKPISGAVDVTFSLYAQESGGPALWFETQMVQADALGHYTALLGAMTAAGVPMELFTGGEARWLGVQVSNLPEQSRVLLVSVPYAMKAGDAETLGGRPASAYVLAACSGDASCKGSAPADDASIAKGSAATTRTSSPAAESKRTTPLAAAAAGPTNFSGSTTDQVVKVTQTGTGVGLSATATSNNAIVGTATAATGAYSGVKGITNSTAGAGVFGVDTAAGGWAVEGYASSSTGTTVGVQGVADSTSGTAMSGWERATSGATIGLVGSVASTGGTGLVGKATALSGATKGILATVSSPGGTGLVINNLAGGKLFSGQNNGAERIYIDANGNILTAGTFNAALFLQPSVTDTSSGLSQTGANVLAGYLGATGGNKISVGVTSATIAGGGQVFNGFDQGNRVTDDGGTIGGGVANQAGNGSGTVSDRAYATVGGGSTNTASGTYSTIAGGNTLTASGDDSAVAGGYANTASGEGAAIGGGWDNQAAGSMSAVPGGFNNNATGASSLAAGAYATAGHDGDFVWGDASSTSVISAPAANQFVVRAAGGVWLGTGNTVSFPASTFLATSTGATLTTSGTWTNNSDRNLKAAFAPVDGEALLARLDRIPIQSWQYKVDAPQTRHLGPMAQDFFSAFGLGNDDRHISTVDEEGVALAGVQALYRLDKQSDSRLEKLERERALDAIRIVQLSEENRRLKQELDRVNQTQSRILDLEARLRRLEMKSKTGPPRARKAAGAPRSRRSKS